jgi:hypothetical protein
LNDLWSGSFGTVNEIAYLSDPEGNVIDRLRVEGLCVVSA